MNQQHLFIKDLLAMKKIPLFARTLSFLRIFSCAMLVAGALETAIATTGTWGTNWTGVSGTVYANQMTCTAISGDFEINSGVINLAGTTPAISLKASRTLTIALPGRAGLIKANTGNLALTGNNTAASGTLTVAAGATLGGNGPTSVLHNVTRNAGNNGKFEFANADTDFAGTNLLSGLAVRAFSVNSATSALYLQAVPQASAWAQLALATKGFWILFARQRPHCNATVKNR